MPKDETGVSDTCPKINKIIDALRKSYANSQPIDFYVLNKCEAILEDIRQANGELRTIANQSMHETKDLESLIEIMIDDIDETIKEIEYDENTQAEI